MDVAIPDVHPVRDRVACRRAVLDDPPAHDPNVVDGSAADNDPAREVPALRPGARERPHGSVVRAYPQIAGSSG